MRIRHSLLVAAAVLFSHRASAESERIPLQENTIYTYAAAYPAGDEEHIATLSALDEQSATFTVEFRSLKDATLNQTWMRSVRRKDFADGHRINEVFQSGDPDTFPGSTFTHLSGAALDELKRTGQTPMVFGTVKNYQGLGSASMFEAILAGRKYFRGVLKRVGTGIVKIPVLVNGKRVLLPGIETSGTFAVGGDEIQVQRWWLDDPANALVLRSGGNGKRAGQLIRIDFPQPQAQASVLATELASGDCRTGLNGIYFDTARADLLPQSKPALLAVAKLVREHPGWTIAIEGHTDNVGKPAYNLDLSKRRAMAVRDALTGEFKISAARLPASGYGDARPIAPNTTLDGRAANRRVELARTCPST